MAAVKAFNKQKRADETSSESERSDDEEAETKTTPASNPASDGRGANKVASTAAAQIGCDPYKPSQRSPTVVSPQPSSPTRPQAEGLATEQAAWKSKRNAHYSEMAAAMRAAPPPSDEEDSSEDEKGA